MNRHYLVSIKHHSLASAPVLKYYGTLASAKRFAAVEFGKGYNDHLLIVMDDMMRAVSTRRIGDSKWTDNP